MNFSPAFCGGLCIARDVFRSELHEDVDFIGFKETNYEGRYQYKTDIVGSGHNTVIEENYVGNVNTIRAYLRNPNAVINEIINEINQPIWN
jgi:hypothetical protein